MYRSPDNYQPVKQSHSHQRSPCNSSATPIEARKPHSYASYLTTSIAPPTSTQSPPIISQTPPTVTWSPPTFSQSPPTFSQTPPTNVRRGRETPPSYTPSPVDLQKRYSQLSLKSEKAPPPTSQTPPTSSPTMQEIILANTGGPIGVHVVPYQDEATG